MSSVQRALKRKKRERLPQPLGASTESSSSSAAILTTAESMIRGMPLSYLKSKPSLRKYVIDIAVHKLVAPLHRCILRLLQRAFAVWKCPPVIQVNERQFGVLVICKVMSNMMDHMMKRAFQVWAKKYSSTLNPLPLTATMLAILEIQRWYRHHFVHIKRKRLRKAWYAAVHGIMVRQRAISHYLRLEKQRVAALQKLRLGISYRRRYYFGCRTIQRVWRWKRRCIRTRVRLTRRWFARVIRNWWRRGRRKNGRAWWTETRIIVQCGGFFKVFSRMPARHLKFGYHGSLHSCSRQLQRFYFSAKGKFALYMRISATRDRRLHEARLDRAARIIQNTYYVLMWRQHLAFVFQYNRARRIQRGIKSYHRRLSIYNLINARKQRSALLIQQFFKKYKDLRQLYIRFRRRQEFNQLRSRCSARIAHMYRSHRVWMEYKRIKTLKFYALLRGKTAVLHRCAAFIQKNWRVMHNLFPRHVNLLMHRLERERRALRLRKVILPIAVGCICS